MALGFRIDAVYTAPNGINYLDPDDIAWDDAFGTYLGPGDPGNSGWMGAIFSYDSNALANVVGDISGSIEASYIEYINSSDSSEGTIRVVIVTSTSPAESDMSIFNATFYNAVANAGQAELGDVFDSLSQPMVLYKNNVELWSDIPTL